jgi:MFS family permease
MSAVETTSTQATPADVSWGAKVIMICGGLLVTLTLTALNAVLPQIESALSRAPEDSMWAKQVVGIIGLSIMIGAPLTGWLIDRFSMKRVLIIASLLVALAGTTGLYLSNLQLLVATRFVTGAAAAGIATCGMTLINTRLAGNTRARWMGMHVSAYMGCSVVFFPLAGQLGEISWRWPFALYLLGIPLALIVAVGFNESAVTRRATAAPAVQAGPGQRLIDWFPFRFAVLGFCVGCVTYTSAIYLPYAFHDIGISSPRTISLVLMVSVIIPAGMAMLYGRIQRRISMLAIFALCFAAAGLGAVVISYANDLAAIVVGIAIYSLGLGLLVPNLMTSLGQNVSPANQGRAVGLVKASQYVAAPLVAAGMDPLARRYGADATFVSLAALALVVVAVMGYGLLFRRARPATEAAPG